MTVTYLKDTVIFSLLFAQKGLVFNRFSFSRK